LVLLEEVALAVAILALSPAVYQAILDYLWPWPFWVVVRTTIKSVSGATLNAEVSILNLSGRTGHFDVDFVLQGGDLYTPRNRVEDATHRKVDETHHVAPHDKSILRVSAADLTSEDKLIGVGVREPRHLWAGKSGGKGYRLYRL
jgi:hypothetical protein